MTLIFRVEHRETGAGPYTGSRWPGQRDMSSEHTWDGQHPDPARCFRLFGIKYDQQCGCKSPASLLAWFDGWWDQLDDHGFVVRVIRGRRRVGHRGQVLYRPARSRVVGTLDIETFRELFADHQEELT